MPYKQQNNKRCNANSDGDIEPLFRAPVLLLTRTFQFFQLRKKFGKDLVEWFHLRVRHCEGGTTEAIYFKFEIASLTLAMTGELLLKHLPYIHIFALARRNFKRCFALVAQHFCN